MIGYLIVSEEFQEKFYGNNQWYIGYVLWYIFNLLLDN